MAALRMNERLHLVVPIYSEDEETVRMYIHSAPISREVFESSFMLISRTFATIHGSGLGDIAGPRVASLVLRQQATALGDIDGAISLMNEIRRLSNVTLRDSGVWTTLPYQEAVTKGLIDGDDMAEAENAIVFFTVASAMLKRQLLKELLPGAVRLWGAQTTSYAFTAFVDSLRTSNAAENTGETAVPVSLVPF